MRTLIIMLRLPNLIIIALTFFLLRYLIFIPVYSEVYLEPAIGNVNYSLLIITTLLIAAAGYVANDYFDVVADRVNKPHKQYIDKLFQPGSALAISITLSTIALILTFWLSFSLQSWLPATLLILALAVAWLYAIALKKSFLWGNIAVSCMSAGTIAMAWLTEKQVSILPDEVSNRITVIISAISVFAFMLSLLREIVKDMEDMKGDLLIQCHTLPIVKGIPFTKKILVLLALVTFVLLIVTQVYLLQYAMTIAAIWLTLAVEIPLVYFLVRLKKARLKPDFHSLSSILKWIMVGGIASIVAGQF